MYQTDNISAQGHRYPDFVIGGAPKCGTTSLHMLLGQHDDIGLPDNEILFHDADDPIVHSDFFRFRDKSIDWFDPTPANTTALDWYASRFTPFHGCKLIGEDSPTYLFSEVAARRIRQLMPDVRLIFTLRNPVKRAYSQYWHLVRSGRATESFEKTIVRNPSILLGSTYTPHLKRYFDLFGPDQVRVVLFEDFTAAPQETLDTLTDYLGVDRFQIDPEKLWQNRTTYPVVTSGQLALNQVGRHIVATRYRKHMGGPMTRWDKMLKKLHYRWFEYINPILLKSSKAPKIESETLNYLQSHLSARNAGLSDLLDRDVTTHWDGVTV
ncbi:sulfotransferase family protein [Actibacterium ureilyticum]|uniref:sulfotransferase family protein n=1 Tax=Actibacterium ureilyticum TaxID=1590614 RepID=UPI000BAAF46C|nr:sulfotransferase [Actibacterium ureilyticum]